MVHFKYQRASWSPSWTLENCFSCILESITLIIYVIQYLTFKVSQTFLKLVGVKWFISYSGGHLGGHLGHKIVVKTFYSMCTMYTVGKCSITNFYRQIIDTCVIVYNIIKK